MDKQIKDKSYIVYKRQLKNDNRVYIGYTKLSLHERAGRNGRKYANCEKFFDAILEYGWDNFESQILKENLSKKEAIYWESFYIQQYNSIQNRFNTDNTAPVIEKLVPRMLDDAFRLTIDKIFNTQYSKECIDQEGKYKTKYKLNGFKDDENIFEFLCNIGS